MENTEKKIYVVCSADGNYAQHLTVMACSLLENASQERAIHFKILDGGISEENKAKIISSLQRYGNRCYLDFISMPVDEFDGLQETNYISKATYYRIEIPNIFQELDRVLYIDCDMVVEDDVAKLWDIEFDDRSLVAAKCAVVDLADYYQNVFGIASSQGFFNAGMMLMNLRKMREVGISEKVFVFLRKNFGKLIACDQDGLNFVFSDDWKMVDPSWNQDACLHTYKNDKYTTYTKKDFYFAKKHPKIIHFTGPEKPWLSVCTHPFKKRYFYYLEKTCYRGYKPEIKVADFVRSRMKFFIIKSTNLIPGRIYDGLVWIMRRINVFKAQVKRKAASFNFSE